jgi:methylated-DNA-[protein]-cysteine S-methyltransferase
MREYKTQTKEIILTTTFSTPIGEMFAAASKKGIVMLTFFMPFHLEAKIQILKNILDADVIPGNCEIFDMLKIQLEEYFKKERTIFKIPLQLVGSPFQIKCWKELLKIPYGKTISYKEEAINIENEKACRAVGNANGQNMIAILVPCHRVISNNGKIGGYSSGVEKKEFLLKLENDK